MTRPLHDHQAEALVMLRQSLRSGHRRPMLQAPTGYGKTLLGAAIVEGAMRKGNRVVFTVPAITLIDQSVKAFGAEGLTDLGVIQAEHPLTNWAKPLQIASVQTLQRRDLPNTELVIVDEAHQNHQVIFRWMQQRPDLIFIGLSATPWTRGLGKHYDDLLIAATTADLIERGFLSPFRVYAPSHPDLSGVHTVAGDYHEGELADAMDKPELTADIVSTWLRLGENRPTFCFAVNRAHAHSLADQFERAGVTTAYIDAFTERPERQVIGANFNAGRTRVVVNVGCLTTGVDWDVRCLILARPTKSEILFTQIMGRALRTAPGKVDALILDHSDTTLRLGFVDSIRHDRLDDGKPKQERSSRAEQKEKLPRECSACQFLKPAGVHKCPACGFAPERREDIEVRDGELALLRGQPKRADKATKQRFWSGLCWYVTARGRSHGWALATYRDRFGMWPRGLRDIPAPADTECRNYVKAKAIAWRKQMEKRSNLPNAA